MGAGRMGGALLRGWVRQGLKPLAAVETAPGADLRTLARRHRIRLFSRLEDVRALPVAACVVALKPQVLRTEAGELAPIARSGALMVSIAAGTGIARLRKAWGAKATIVRAMPNTPGAVGRGISALYAARSVAPAQRARAEALLQGFGPTFWVGREDLIDAVTAVSGSGPAYVFLFTECLARAAEEQGFSRAVAQRLARATVSGAGALLDYDAREPALLRRDVTSPGGTTEAALAVLMADDALARLLDRAVAAARQRATELRD